MALENPALNECSFQRGIEETEAEPHDMTASGTYAIAGLLLLLVVVAATFGWSEVEIVTYFMFATRPPRWGLGFPFRAFS